MKARLLVIGDLHFSSRSLPILEQLKTRILEAIQTTKPDHLVFLGDTHDRFGTINSTRSREVVEFFYEVSLLVPFTLLIGNHDIPNKTLFYSEDHGFTALKYYWKNVTVVDKCCRFTVNGFNFGAVAYCPNGRLLEGLTPAQPLSQLDAVFCHQEIQGCNINGLSSTEGDKWSSRLCTIFCGHIHLHHTPQSNVHYIGSPYQDSFGEEDHKSISLITFTREEPHQGGLSRCGELSQSQWTEERIYLGLPKKIRLHLTAREFRDWTPIAPNLYSLSITGTNKECSQIRESQKYKKMTVDGNKAELINQVSTDEVPVETSTHRVPLAELISSTIENMNHLHSLHKQVFRQ